MLLYIYIYIYIYIERLDIYIYIYIYIFHDGVYDPVFHALCIHQTGIDIEHYLIILKNLVYH